MRRKRNLKPNTPFLFSYLLLGLVPAALFFLYLLVMTALGAKIRLIPSVQDEMFWYHQITAIVKSGKPLGYYGYNAGHAAYGTFGPWGIAILLPYALLGKIFGWHLYSMSLCNLFFLCSSLFAFGYLGRLGRRQLIATAIGYALMLPNIQYTIANMAEPARWAMGILLTGCILHIYRGYAGKWFTYLLVPLLILFCTQAYLLLGLFLPIYLLCLLPVRSFPGRGLLSLGLSAPVLYLERTLLHLSSAGYTREQSATGLSRLTTNVRHVLRLLKPTVLWRLRTYSFGLPSLWLTLFLLLLIATGLTLIHRLRLAFCKHSSGSSQEAQTRPSAAVSEGHWAQDHQLMCALTSTFLLGGSLACYALFYPAPGIWTLLRGLHTAMLCSVLLFCVTLARKRLALTLLLCLLCLYPFTKVCLNSLDTRYQSGENMQLLQQTAEEFESVFTISPRQTP